ncbi:hypothetical protein PpBr36_04781 [Pyricularia pennisetigena]|uniref:hypothetical protein n=1 Tax=Pyricularia pennisetigena TaxID=1578925 RepID=UPI00115091BF|nr:hypothetical protein PpBr36_04781 [Pyricularia pennisetigena]TLS26122.1 hypothetical protein PpBr36_04781 [Pyricularia pennisetigena]
MTENPHQKKPVLIVGAGPSGLLLALLLSQRGIPVQILEADAHLDDQPRAAHYGSAALPDLDRAGVLGEIKKRGIIITDFAFRYPVPAGSPEDKDGSGFAHIATLDTSCVQDVDGFDYRSHCLVLQDLDALMLEMLIDRLGDDVVRWRHRVVDVGQDEERKVAWVDVRTPEGRKRVEGDYVVGCDGASSQVRRSLFGQDYPGFTWEKQIVATNTYYDFTKFGWGDVNMIIHPENFFASHPPRRIFGQHWLGICWFQLTATVCVVQMAAKMDSDGLYRVTYGEKPGLTTEQMRARQAARFEEILPGHPKPSEYTVVNFSPYKMHQRCAPSFRVGRILLAADAAHLCNPWGGLGITGGFVDVGGLADCFIGINEGLADESILDLYSEKRLEKWKTVTDPISQGNFRRIGHTEDPSSLGQTDEFMQLLKKAELDPQLAKPLAMGSLALRYDFTQHYRQKDSGTSTS